MEEEGTNMSELLDPDEYLVPQPNIFQRSQTDGVQSNGPSRHQSYRVSVYNSRAITLVSHLVGFLVGLVSQTSEILSGHL